MRTLRSGLVPPMKPAHLSLTFRKMYQECNRAALLLSITRLTFALMKYGAHCYLFTEKWSDRTLPLLDHAKELGLDMFELSVGDDVVFDPHRVGSHAAALGLDLLVGPGGLWPPECDLSADEAPHRALGLAWHKRVVDLCAELGARAYCGALYGHPGIVKKRRPPGDEFSRTAEGLHSLADYAARRNVAIALEPMSHFRTHVANTPGQLLRLIRLADHPNLRVLFDTYHIVTEVRDYGSALRAIGPLLYALHACENDRGVPGNGLVPWTQVFDALASIGFNGYIGLEGYNSFLGDFAFERGMFHDVCPDGSEFVRHGIAFLKSMEARPQTS
jgi:D-psicose/D-tagatose/L-ribulose 3-epimerase